MSDRNRPTKEVRVSQALAKLILEDRNADAKELARRIVDDEKLRRSQR